MSDKANSESIAVVGAGGLGREIANLIDRQNLFAGFYDDKKVDENYLGDLDHISSKQNVGYVIAVGNPIIKKELFERLKGKLLTFKNVISNNSIFPMEFIEGVGTIVCDGVKLTVNCSIGSHVLLNLNVTVGHDVVIGDYCSIMPGANISGNVNIGEATLIGSGAIILQGIKIGSNVKVGAGAVVTKNVPDNTTVVGVPAKSINN